ncbi:MAG: lysine 2,3-aminomutase [Deltaproteobacteria bacterium HGW-Deltaproteobacteria-10]|nr:MAG: lysine 2,3-aminomutase [Deltaproteobacteria bacterium HGW-Deltaproteobacteria-10]
MNKNRKSASRLIKTSDESWQDWRWQFKNRITKPEILANLLQEPAAKSEELKRTAAVYRLAITPYYFSLINRDNENDPIKRQCLPDSQEILHTTSSADPLEEDSHMPVPKLVHRYPDRCLAIVTEICATYCRHCNRKRFWSSSQQISLKKRLKNMIGYISESTQIREVIISGGDPLTLEDNALEYLLVALRSIPHVEVLRIGSRAPVVMPMRITPDLCRILKRARPLWFNTQFNHPAEITADSARACNMLLEAGIPVSNQSVLLAGINDSTEVMRNLLYGLQKISVRPYYLFHCDPVRGCEHFRTDVRTCMVMMENIWRQCSGLSLPQYVLDVPGSTGKIPLNVMSRAIKKDLQKHQHFFDKFK